MSSSSSVTVDNTDIFVEQMNTVITQSGLQPLPAGTTADDAADKALALVRTKTQTQFATDFAGTALPPSNIDGGFMQPYSANVAGTAPQCVLDQVTMDLTNWNLPLTNDIPTAIAKTITSELSFQAGDLGFSSGTVELGPLETVLWVAGYVEYDVTQTTKGVVYAFTAAMQ